MTLNRKSEEWEERKNTHKKVCHEMFLKNKKIKTVEEELKEE